MICLKCGKEIGEEAYFDKATDELIGCGKCCQFDMEQDGIPLVTINENNFIAFDRDVKVMGSFEIDEADAIQQEEMEEFYRYG